MDLPQVPDNTRISRTEDISKGLIGSLLNVSGAANTRKYQEAAMKSRLQIPLLFGLDVIHGYRTGFPLPLAEAASFDLDAIERGSRCAAKELQQPGCIGRLLQWWILAGMPGGGV